MHSGERPFVCHQCGKAFTLEKSLMTHSRLHSREKAFPCDKCEERFYSKHGLIRHSARHTEFACNECGRKFRGKSDLVKHALLHKREQSADIEKVTACKSVVSGFACSECAKEVKSKWQLEQHKRLHTGELPFICNDCGVWFSKIKEHDAHKCRERVLVRRRVMSQFVCFECGKRVKSNWQLKQHKRLHTGEPPFVCDDCGVWFSEIKEHDAHRCRPWRKTCVLSWYAMK